MDEQGNSLDTIQTVENINSQITDLRQSQSVDEYRSGTFEQKKYQEKKAALYAQRRELTNATITNATSESNLSLSEIDDKISEVRSNPAYGDTLRNGTLEKKELKTKMDDLYRQRRDVTDGDFSRADDASMNPDNMGNLTSQARSELEQLAELGMDVSGEDISDITQHDVDGYRRVRLIEQSDFKELSNSMPKAARAAGYSIPEVSALKGFLAAKFDGTNGLKRKILRVISEDIYNSKGV